LSHASAIGVVSRSSIPDRLPHSPARRLGAAFAHLRAMHGRSTVMQITDILAQMGGIQSIARELGVSETEAARGADALAPAVLGGFKKQAQAQPAGLEGLGGLLGQLGGGSLLDDVVAQQP